MGLSISRLKLKDGSVHTVFFHGPEIEHNPCITHSAMLEEYQKSGALREALSNVIPFRKRT